MYQYQLMAYIKYNGIEIMAIKENGNENVENNLISRAVYSKLL